MQTSELNIPGGSETVLVVDDDPLVRRLCTEILSRKGYHTIDATNGEDALRVFENLNHSPPNLVVTDVEMPQMGGVELSSKLHDSYPDIKLLFISGYSVNTNLCNSLLGSKLHFLQKPFSCASLLNKVREILDNYN
ncbi:response regulator [Candidatus Omnitrophota bacterium]